ncbi:hypothetical protein COCNU_01G012850 [Cocos nucifera]|uniref:Chlorophyll a-b binding protein, chloroplastic n=1 Tax=Cocos nucifera TaxID=13894 RepID=A0A8K0HVB5_COCNU|nr:hypothetical protein COCNU_01G012850 [Cocos nucifera]
MASAAFKSSTKRSTIGGAAEDAGSCNRRSRSLSCYSGRIPPPPPPESDEFPSPRARFVNRAGFPEISLDDLAYEFFGSKGEEDEDVRPAVFRSGRRGGCVSYGAETDSSRRRGRSVSRHPSRTAEERKGILEKGGGSKGVSESRYRRQRSVSAARHRYGDSTSQSSALTDHEAQNSRRRRGATEKTIQADYAQRKKEHLSLIEDGKETRLYEAMCKEVRHAVEEIRMEIEKMMVKTESSIMFNGEYNLSNDPNGSQAIAEIRRNYTTKLEQSEKSVLDLLAELSVKEQCGQELASPVRELLPVPKQTSVPENPSWSRRMSNDRTRTPKRLTDEAGKYIKDFLLNVEDTDFSSYDGERSETSSTTGGSAKIRDFIMHNTLAETHESLTGAASMPVETDGVVLPWLQWETSNDGPPTPSQGKIFSVGPGNKLFPEVKEANGACDDTNYLRSSLGSWSPEVNSSCSVVLGDIAGSSMPGEVGRLHSSCSVTRQKANLFDLDEYVHLRIGEDHLFERFRQKQRIDSEIDLMFLLVRWCWVFPSLAKSKLASLPTNTLNIPKAFGNQKKEGGERIKAMATQALLSSVEAGRQLLGGKPLRSTSTRSAASPRKASFVVRASSTPPIKQGADRQLWFASEQSLAYLDGSFPGDYGFDRLGLSDPEGTGGFIEPKWLAYGEVINGRYAMLGAVGAIAPESLGKLGLIPPETALPWFKTGVLPPAGTDNYWAKPYTLFVLEMALMGLAEHRRFQDWAKPGSMGKQYFVGFQKYMGG